MRMHRDKAPAGSPAPFIERRRDDLTRTVVDGLQKMLADFEKLPHGPERTAAIAAVTRFAHRIAEALERRKRAGSEKAKGKQTAFPGAIFAKDSADVLRQ